MISYLFISAKTDDLIRATDNVNLQMIKEDILIIIGENSSGKTTTEEIVSKAIEICSACCMNTISSGVTIAFCYGV